MVKRREGIKFGGKMFIINSFLNNKAVKNDICPVKPSNIIICSFNFASREKFQFFKKNVFHRCQKTEQLKPF